MGFADTEGNGEDNKNMDFLHHRGTGSRTLDFSSLDGSMSPLISRRRSVSPLMSPSCGTMSLQLLQRNRQQPSFPQTDDEQLHLFQERIIWNQEKSLLPLAHDLADWLSSILGVELNTANLMETLETGVILCQLAKLIEGKASNAENAKIKPRLKGRVRENARRQSFFARDNVAMFINFCKDLGVHNNLLFETEDLVSHGEIRSVLICLMEVGRLSVKYGIDPPALVALERQIEEDQSKETQMDSLPEIITHDRDLDYREDSVMSTLEPPAISDDQSSDNNLSDSTDSGLPAEEEQTNHIVVGIKEITDLDIKVNEVARTSGQHCSCVEETRRNFKLRKISEGKYSINGRTVFVRLLKGVHVMVRIGGGWETLEEFLVRNDPCRARKASSDRVQLRKRHSFSQQASSPTFRPASSPPITNGRTGYSSACSTPSRSNYSSRTSLYNQS